MGKPVSRSSGSLGTLSIGGKVVANVKDVRITPMSSDNTDRLMRDLECLLDSDWGQDDDTVGYLPPPPQSRRAAIPVVNQGTQEIPAYRVIAVAQSNRATAANMAAVGRMLTGSGVNQPAGVINAHSKPAKKQPPSTDLTNRPKRKITLE